MFKIVPKDKTEFSEYCKDDIFHEKENPLSKQTVVKSVKCLLSTKNKTININQIRIKLKQFKY